MSQHKTQNACPLLKELDRLTAKPKFKSLRGGEGYLKEVTIERRVVTVILRDRDTGIDVTGIARCSPQDSFVFMTGFSIAATRAIEGIQQVQKRFRSD